MSTNLRGGHGRPASEDVGPGSHEAAAVSDLLAPKRTISFGRADRFSRDGAQFLSHSHTAQLTGTHSPGPKYLREYRPVPALCLPVCRL